MITHRPSALVVCLLSVHSHFLAYTLASTNINKSAPNLVKIFMTIRSQMNLIMDLIGPEHQELFALDFKKKLLYFTHTLASTNINQSAPNLVKIYMTIRSRMSFDFGSNQTRTTWVICPWIEKNCYVSLCSHSSIYKYQPISTKLGQNIYDRKISDVWFWVWLDHNTQVICPWIKKIAMFHFVYTLASTNINQSAPNMVKIYMTISPRMSLILDLIGLEQPELFAL